MASAKSIGEDLSPLRIWLAEVDVAAVATPSAIKTFSGLAEKKLSMLEQLDVPGGPNKSATQPVVKIFQQALSAVGDELQLAAIGIRADEAGTVRRDHPAAANSWWPVGRRGGPRRRAGAFVSDRLARGTVRVVEAIQFSEPLRKLMVWCVSEQGRTLNPADWLNFRRSNKPN